MLKLRLIFGPVMIAALVALFYFDNWLDQLSLQGTSLASLFLGRAYLPAGLPMLVAFLMVIPLAARELVAIFHAKGIEADPKMVTLSGVIGCSLLYVVPSKLDSQKTMAVFATVVVVLFLASLLEYSFKQKRTQGAVAVAGATMFALIYLGLLPGFYIAIRRWHTAWLVACIILVVKSSDIGAYFTGRAIGKNKLIPWLSPGKTWEGLVGGMIFSGLVAVLLMRLVAHFGAAYVWQKIGQDRQQVPLHILDWQAFFSGAVIALVGQFGDLCASLFKRDAGFKDSGHTIPGFGGVLDVIDSPIVVAPLAYWLLVWAAKVAQLQA